MQARSYCRLQGVYLFIFYFSPFWVVVAFPVRLAGVCLLSNCLFASRTLPALTCSHTTIDRLLGLRSSIFHLKPLFSLLFFFFFSVLSLGNALALTDFLPHSGNAPSVCCSRRAWASTSQRPRHAIRNDRARGWSVFSEADPGTSRHPTL